MTEMIVLTAARGAISLMINNFSDQMRDKKHESNAYDAVKDDVGELPLGTLSMTPENEHIASLNKALSQRKA